MNSYSLTRSNFKDIFDRLSAEYRLFGPKRLAGRGRFSDTDLITCDFLADIDELEFEEKSFMSPKSVVFPADETIFVFNEEEFKEPLMRDQREIIVFLRPCDINGFARLDKIFLENGDRVDPYYQRRRQKIHFFMIECSSSFENCFCVAMQSNHTDNYAVALRFDKESIEIQIRNDHFNRFFESFGT
ncbi:MAG: anaerobic sulfite reductase subunit A, partial [Candidatus Riflebacteria bacterium]